MTSLTLDATDRCPLCGCRISGVCVGSYRVNKSSLRQVGSPGLVFQHPVCRECGFETEAPAQRWRLDPTSLLKVNAARAKKGWPLWGRPSPQPAGAPL